MNQSNGCNAQCFPLRRLAVAARRALPVFLLVQALVAGAETVPVPAPPTDVAAVGEPVDGAPLSLEEAIQRALTDQPILAGRNASILASDALAIASAQLPDPRLSGGLKELPVTTSEAFSLRQDNFTELTVGIRQDFPTAEKRRLRGLRKHLDADVDRAELDNDERLIRREVGLAWLDVYEAEQGLALARQLEAEAALQVKTLEKDYASGKASQADWFAAKVEASLLADRSHDWYHRALRQRAALSRWIGDAANRPLPDRIPALEPAGSLAALDAGLDLHPAIRRLDKQIEASHTDMDLARQAYKSDLSVEGYVAYRRDYASFVGVQVSIDLPWFTENRQDRGVVAAVQQASANEDRKRTALLELRATVHQDFLDSQHFSERVRQFDERVLPDAQRRVESARAAYGAGRGSFDAVLLARRSELDIRLQRLALVVDAERAQVRLRYYATTPSASGESQ